MSQSYYIFRNGRLRRKHNTLYFEYENAENGPVSQPIPVEDVKDIFLFGETDLNTKLLNFLAQNGIVLHCFNYYGFYSGSFYPRETNVSGYLVVKQVEHYLENEKRMYLAREFVGSSLYHIRRNLNYYKTRGRNVAEFIDVIEGCMVQLDACRTIPELMREEGKAREEYYKAFNEILDLEEPFEKRVRRPPDNMLNALISFINTIVYTTALSEIYVTQLNPTISYLHEPSNRRFSLALDIAEIFKPLVGDRVLFRLINKGMIEEKDFGSIGDVPAIYLKDEARKKVVREIEDTWRTTVQHRKLKRHVSYRQLVRLEAYKLIKHLTGMEQYRALRAWW